MPARKTLRAQELPDQIGSQAARTADVAGGVSWRPAVDERYLFAGIAIALFLTSFLVDSAFYGHNEGLILLFLVLALRVTPRNLLLGGICAGLALASKQTTFMDLLPVGFVLLAGGRAVGRADGGARSRPGGSVCRQA